MGRPTIVVAAGDGGRQRAANALSSAYDLVFVSTLEQAKTALGVACDAVVSCTVFDDSRMFELLETVRATRSLEHLPFLVVRFDHHPALSPSSRRSLEILLASLVEVHDLPDSVGDRLLQAAVAKLMKLVP